MVVGQAATDGRKILDIGGLLLSASCRRLHIEAASVEVALPTQRLRRALGRTLYQLVVNEVAEQQTHLVWQRLGTRVEPLVIQQHVPHVELPRAARRRISV